MATTPTTALTQEHVRKGVIHQTSKRLRKELKSHRTFYTPAEVEVLPRAQLVGDVIKLRMLAGSTG